MMKVLAVGLVWGFVVPASARATENQPGAARLTTADSSRYVYVFGVNGQFLKADLRSGAVSAQGALDQIEGLAQLLPNPSDPRDSWRVDDARFGRADHRLYLAVPTAIGGEGSFGEQIIVLQLPGWTVVGTIPLPQELNGSPRLLLTPDGKQLLVSYGTAPREDGGEATDADVIDIYDTSTLQRVNRIVDSPSPAEKARGALTVFFSSDASFAEDGRTIHDKGTIATLRGGSFERKPIQPLDHLDAEQRRAMQTFLFSTTARDMSAVFVNAVDGAAGKALVRFADRQGSKKGMLVLDLGRKTISPIVEVKGLSGTHLSRDGRWVLLEELEIRNEKAFKTGLLQLFEVESGTMVHEIRQPAELAGEEKSHHLACSSFDAGRTLYISGRNGWILDLMGDARPLRLKTTLPAEMSVCVPADT
jgi:hypothetical protein